MIAVASSALDAVARLGGAALSGATRLVAVRPAAKPLHPRGDVLHARLQRVGARPPTGVAWLDGPGTDDVLVRSSRAVGLPGVLPDIHGLAIRVPVGDGRHGDLLLASTGLGRLTRFVLTASRSPQGRPMTSLLPYRTQRGPVLLAAEGVSDNQYELRVASPGGEWRTFGHLTLASTSGADAMVSFDPVRSTLPGLDNFEWVRRLREPAYRRARHTRGDAPEASAP